MNRAGLLMSIAETGYNVGFGAKKNFATHDIVQKMPGFIGFVSLAVGVYGLVWEQLNSKQIAATLLVLGVMSLYITHYDHNKSEYGDEGQRLTALFYRLRDLYRDVEAKSDSEDLKDQHDRLEVIQTEFFAASQTKQILFSDWYAHYKFFWQHQIEWIDDQKHFGLFRDKLPLSFMVSAVAAIIAALALASGVHCAI
ncbi:SLATT domain-containing protein [Novosphingobium sp. PS1R-30]|uniref:SLATT domain-containing protein n=1 Tax=Novosphingobium anseongense TaxID=3133436 RepID=A0ABU8RWZ3_9SPHN